MLFKIPDPRDGSTPRAGLPFTRVGPVWMVLTLGLVVVVFFVMGALKSGGGGGGEGTERPAATRPTDGEPIEPDRFVREPKIDVLDDGELARQYPETVREELQKELFDWWQTPGRQMIADARDELETEWVGHLLSDDVRPRLERLPSWVFGELQKQDRVLEEPGPHRGKLVQVWGAVVSSEPVLLPVTPPKPAWRVRIDDPDGRAWTVVTNREPSDAIVTGSWARASGVFVKLRPAEEGRVTFLVFSAQSLVPSYAPVESPELSPEWAAAIDDSTVEASQKRLADEDSFWMLMNHVKTIGTSGWRERVASGAIRLVDMTSARGATDLAQKPALHRFEPVRLRVGVGKGEGAFVTEPDLPENVGNIRSAFRGYVIDDQQRIVWVMSPLPAENFPMGNARLAIVEGYFYRRMAVEKKQGGMYWMPVVVAASITPIDTTKAPSTAIEQATWIVILGAVACMALLAFLLLRRSREGADVRRRQEERLARRRRGGAAK